MFYKHSRIKQYLKEGRALRVETVVNQPNDLGCQRRLGNLDQLQPKARAANRRLLTIERAGQGCAIATELFERVALPSTQEGQPTGALRLGDPRVMALAGALAIQLNAVAGFTNHSLRAHVAGLLGTPTPPARGPTTCAGSAARASSAGWTIATPTPSLATAPGSRCSPPSSTTGCSAHCWPPTSPTPPSNSARRCASSTAASTAPSPTAAREPPPELDRTFKISGTKGS